MEVTVKKTIGSLNENTIRPVGGDSNQKIERDAMNAALVQKTADIMHCSTSDVYKVLRGDRTNEQVFACYMELSQGVNKLVKAVEKLVPFDIN